MKTMKEYLSTAEGVKQMWEKINSILDNFDFSKVVTVMEALDWSWACNPGEAEEYSDLGRRVKWGDENDLGNEYYPEYPELLKAARERLVGAIETMPDDRTSWSESSGGFRAEVDIMTDEERADYYGGEIANVDDFAHSVDLRLSFVVEESDTY